MVTKELILQEMDSMSEPTLAKVLEFVRWLNYTGHASIEGIGQQSERQTSQMVTVVSSDGGEVSVPLKKLLNDNNDLGIPLHERSMVEPIVKVRQELIAALKNSGYASTADIVKLVQDVKKEMWVERDSIQ